MLTVQAVLACVAAVVVGLWLCFVWACWVFGWWCCGSFVLCWAVVGLWLFVVLAGGGSHGKGRVVWE